MQCILWHPSLLLVIQSVQNKSIMFSWGEEGGGGGGGGLPWVDTGFFSIGGGYRIFSLGGGYQGWIRDFSIGGRGVTRGGYGIFPLGVGGTGFFHWGVVTKNDYNGIFPLGGEGGGYQGWIRDFSIGGWDLVDETIRFKERL